MIGPLPPYDRFILDRLPAQVELPFFLSAPYTTHPPRLNAAAALLDEALVRGWGERPCLIAPTAHSLSTWTYRHTLAQVNRIAGVLTQDLQLPPGSRVLLFGPNSQMLAACWLAVVKSGLVAVTAMPLLRPTELKAMIDKVQISTALCARSVADALAACRHPDGAHYCASLTQVLDFDEGSLEERMESQSDAFTAYASAADDPCMIAFTSGTTGEPKATVHFHRDILYMCDGFAAHALRPTPADVFCGSSPLGFTFGLGGLLCFPLRFGASTVLLERANADRLIDVIGRSSASLCFSVPTLYRQMARMVDRKTVSTLRRAVSAGEALAPATRLLWEEASGVPLLDGLGSTEMTHIFVAQSGTWPGQGLGMAVPGYELGIFGPHMDERGVDTIGRLGVRGPTGCRYLADPRQADYVQNGWNMTGDLASIDASGWLTYHGRADELIISAGYNIAPAEVEAALLAHPAIAECAVAGQADPERGQTVHALVVLNPGFAPSETLTEGLQSFVKGMIAPYKYPRSMQYVTQLPRNINGKLQRARLLSG